MRCPTPVHYCYISTTCPLAPLPHVFCIYIVVILFETASGLRVFMFKYSLSIIKQGGNDGYTYGKFSMGQVVGIVNARW